MGCLPLFCSKLPSAALVSALLVSACSSGETMSRRDGAVEQDSSGLDAELMLDGGFPDDGAAPEDAALQADGAQPDAASPSPLEALLRQGTHQLTQRARPEFGVLRSVRGAAMTYLIEARRDAETGPYMLPWRTRFRLAAYGDEQQGPAWTMDMMPDDSIGDLVVHPSGQLTLVIEHQLAPSAAYELVRLSADGKVLFRAELPYPSNIPESDYAPSDPRPLLRMKSPLADATSAGWVRLLADGEQLFVAMLSLLQSSPNRPVDNRLALALARVEYTAGAWSSPWARLVEGPHAADPGAWAYDELRWREQAVRPTLLRDVQSGELLVARAFNHTRCEANLSVFRELTANDCVQRAVDVHANERLPLLVTRFSGTGQRLGSRILDPSPTAIEQVPFALASWNGEIVLAGSVVRSADGVRRSYPDGSGFVDYDGYIAFYDREGSLLREHDFNLGRGEVLSALHVSTRGVLGVGASGWDRWAGGMSISRGADPLFAWLALDGSDRATRAVALSAGTRHFTLHDVVVMEDRVVGYGFGDAPMTHSADGGRHDERTFGFLRVQLKSP